jgi:hypothetical protein
VILGAIVNPNPTLFEPRETGEPYSRGQSDSALKATPHSPEGDISYVRALEPTRVRVPTASGLAVLAHC